MHDWIYKKAECLKNELESTGFDNLDNATLEKAYYISKILKNIICIDKDYHIVNAMEKSEDNEKILEMMEKYDDDPEKRFYNTRRYANGEYAPKGKGHYSPLYYTEPHIPDEVYRERDIDREHGKMYYTEPIASVDMKNGSRYEIAKRHYEESKAKHNSNSDSDKKMNTLELEKMINEFKSEMMELKPNMSPEELTMAKQKLLNMSNAFQP